ncbi:MAG: hypothetical protein ACOY90_08635 [Candidatus Zhuqueibacterota bacterium]
MANTPGKIILKLSGVSLVLAAGAILALYLTDNRALFSGVAAGYGFSLFLFLFGFLSIHWAFKKPLKTLMGIVLGGMILRFALIGAAIFVILKFTEIDILIFIVFFFVFYLVYQFFEIRFISATISKGKK